MAENRMSKTMPPFDRAAVAALLRQGLAELAVPRGCDVAGHTDDFVDYLAELHKWNRAYNLTAVRDPIDMVPRHVLDSLTVLPFVAGSSVADVGTGAGLPGIPLALCLPGQRFTLLDANGKKTRFVQHVTSLLGLDNVAVVQARVEQFAPAVPFDTVLCRAYAGLADFVASAGGIAAAHGRLVALKGRYPADELAELERRSASLPGWCVTDCRAVSVPGLEGERHIVVLERR